MVKSTFRPAISEFTPNILWIEVKSTFPHFPNYAIYFPCQITSHNGQPLIFLTAKGQKEDIIAGYSAGADDYLVKPFDTDVLLYKIQAIIGRNLADVEEEPDEIQIGKLTFKPKIRQLIVEDSITKLSPKECDLLKLLAAHKNQLLPRSKALLKIWKEDNYFTGRSMDVYVAKLRKYLKVDESLRIENVHGEGFRLVQD